MTTIERLEKACKAWADKAANALARYEQDAAPEANELIDAIGAHWSKPIKILPCPFPCCGSDKVTAVLHGDSEYTKPHFVTCEKCCCVGPEKTTKEEAIAAWNGGRTA